MTLGGGLRPPSDTSPQEDSAGKARARKGRMMPEPMGFVTDTSVCIGCKA
jgi:hypothetical protein